MKIDLSGKIILITGASRGIGQAILAQLANAGGTVIGTATSEAGAAAISETIKENNWHGCGAVCNVTDTQSISDLLALCQEKFGSIQILVNNAGITRDNLLLRMKESEWDEVIDTDLSACFRLSKLCLKPMLKARWGRIINIGSVVGCSGNPGQANYSAAKAGLCGFSRSLAAEIGSRHITVNVVAPGFIETDMTSSLPETVVNSLLAQTPVGRLGQPDEIAHAVAFLASDYAAFITGQILHVNGGMLMN